MRADHTRGLDVDGRIILKRIVMKYCGWHLIAIMPSGKGTSVSKKASNL
jgi:hypothetical protein